MNGHTMIEVARARGARGELVNEPNTFFLYAAAFAESAAAFAANNNNDNNDDTAINWRCLSRYR